MGRGQGFLSFKGSYTPVILYEAVENSRSRSATNGLGFAGGAKGQRRVDWAEDTGGQDRPPRATTTGLVMVKGSPRPRYDHLLGHEDRLGKTPRAGCLSEMTAAAADLSSAQPMDPYGSSMSMNKTPKEPLKTLLALVFMVVCAVINMMALAVIHDQVPPRERGALPDVVLDHVYTNDWALYVAEYLLMVLVYFCALLGLLHVHRWVVFRRWLFLLGLLYLYRSVTMFVTVLPVASPTYVCNPQANRTTALLVLQRTGELLLGLGLSVNGYHRYCGDYLYSALVFMVVCAVINMMALAVIHDQVPPRERGALPDVVLDHVYTNDWALYVAEYLLMVLVYFCALLGLLHVHRWVVFRRWLFLLGLLYLYRSVTMFVTVLPVASPTYVCNGVRLACCRNEQDVAWPLDNNPEPNRQLPIVAMTPLMDMSPVCLVLVLGALVVREYTPGGSGDAPGLPRLWALHWLTYVWSAAGICMILLSRAHYTVDVVVAYYITTRLFWTYHTLANALHPSLKVGSDKNLWSRTWWHPFFCYMEKNVESPLPKGFDWPLPVGRMWHWLRVRLRVRDWCRCRCRRYEEPGRGDMSPS
ncbi:unnamed protein product [Notodromas monacha]|uniref:Sphingomyelin synthase-like domain-containing protein n=1 Tax=Notodromas monacha TaxID=399045 RepID=A0A7R9BN73_9CRUS|nr:unnamed protein product [Notodromas monacha]CAG0917219.1 unnamed protein product [Notodromas monacha]